MAVRGALRLLNSMPGLWSANQAGRPGYLQNIRYQDRIERVIGKLCQVRRQAQTVQVSSQNLL